MNDTTYCRLPIAVFLCLLFPVGLFSSISLPLAIGLNAEDKQATSDQQSTAKIQKAHPFVAGFEIFFVTDPEEYEGEEEEYYDREIDQVTAGLLLLGDLNCTSCHQLDGKQKQFVSARSAPILSEVGKRLRPEYYSTMLTSPHAVKPGTTMPDMLSGLGKSDRKTVVNELAAFLASTAVASEGGPTKSLIEQGRELFQTVGCLACHGPQDDDAGQIVDSVPLGNLTDKYSMSGLVDFLADPHAVRPSARMPAFGLESLQTRAIASYLLREQESIPNLRYSYYEGNWTKLPDFSTLKPVSEGESVGFDLSVAKLPDHFGLVFKGFLQIKKDDFYRFYLGSDDGSRLLIDGKPVAVNDGIHPLSKSVKGKATLAAGVHEMTLEYFEGGGEQGLAVEIESKKMPRQPLSVSVTMDGEHEQTDDSKPQTKHSPKIIASGKRHFANFGCARCHELNQGEKIEPGLAAKDIDSFSNGWETAGCLGTASAIGTKQPIPDYHLSDPQREALRIAINELRGGKLEFDDSAKIHHQMLAMNCYACHERDEFGGPARHRKELFLSDQEEMGDEGRLPPGLTGIGAKLRVGYLKNLLTKGAKDRPYMLTKMPGFGGSGELLTDKFTKVDKLEAGPKFNSDISMRRLKSEGRKLAGDQGLSCIKCHTFGEFKASGIQSMDMTKMTTRLREDWFVEYLINPNKFRPGTRMPESWRKETTQFPDILDGNARLQIHSVWRFLEDGTKAAVPLGLLPAKMELIPQQEPLIYRNFIEGAGSRAIGVGYPGKVNLAFDANQMRLALLWHGSFIDPGMHWTGRGQGFQKPMGENVLSFQDTVTLAELSDIKTSWPNGNGKEVGVRFDGYRFDKQRSPVFMYHLKELKIDDVFVTNVNAKNESTETTPAMERLITFTGESGEHVYFRAVTGREIVELEDDWYGVDGDWKLQVKTSTAPIIRNSQDQMELLVPVRVGESPFTIEQTYRW